MNDPIKDNEVVVEMITELVRDQNEHADPITDENIDECVDTIMNDLIVEGIINSRRQEYVDSITDIILTVKSKGTMP